MHDLGRNHDSRLSIASLSKTPRRHHQSIESKKEHSRTNLQGNMTVRQSMEKYNQLLNFNSKIQKDFKDAETSLTTLDHLLRKKNLLEKRQQIIDSGINNAHNQELLSKFPPISLKHKGVKFIE